MTRWAILTGEYPMQPGGVSEYTRLVAGGLAGAGDEVVVFGPAHAGGADVVDPGVSVCRLPGHFGPRGLFRLDRDLARRPRPDRILIQYVPHAFGIKAMNLPFAAWVATRACRVAPVWVMFHEVAFPFSWRRPSHAVLGVVTMTMAQLLAGAADRVLVSIPAWATMLRQVCPWATAAEWLPIPSNVGTFADPAAVAAARNRYAPSGGGLVGHFGTFGAIITEILESTVTRLLAADLEVRLLLIGRGSNGFRDRLADRHPELAGRVAATGGLPEPEVASHLRACDLLVQPYLDGVSSRRTTMMAGLANGVPVVTNLGPLSEPFWAAAAGVVAAPTPDPAAIAAAVQRLFCAPPSARAEMGVRAAEFYQCAFSLQHTVALLREPGLRSRIKDEG